MLRKIKFLLKLTIILLCSTLFVACSTKKTTSENTVLSYKHSWPKNINYSANKIEFVNTKSLGNLKNKWKDNKNVTIAHFGDSHIQLGWQVGALRDMLQALRGDAGRGMIFPYSIAKTYSQEDYSSSFTGKWKTANSMHQSPKIPLGISGFVASTQDRQAQLQFNFKNNISSSKLDVQVIFKAYGAYDLIVSNGVSSQRKRVNASSASQKVDFTLPNLNRNLTLIVQSIQDDTTFELHGISLNKPNKGVIYHNLGVGGATYSALLKQQLFNEQFAMIDADLVILDWGTNDLIYKNTIAPDLENTIRQTIRKVRAANPKVAILLTSAQEANFKGKAITSSAQYAQLIKRIAQQEGTLFYDWYAVSGKHNSVYQWRMLGFASKDAIHLNQKGYRVRGKLLGDALLNMLNN